MSQYNGEVFVKAVGKYKEQFKSTGLLLVVDGNEFWSDFPGQLSYKDWKEKTISVDIAQNAKGYWSGKIAGQESSSPFGSKPDTGTAFDAPKSSYVQDPPSQERRDVQDEIRFAQALNLACHDHCHDKIDECGKEARVEEYYEILKTRQFPPYMSSTSKIF